MKAFNLSGYSLLVSLAVVCIFCPSGSALAVYNTATLELEGQALDLDTGIVYGGDDKKGTEPTGDLFHDHPSADILIALDADGPFQPVLLHNRVSGVCAAFLEDTPFETVDAWDIPVLNFSRDGIDKAFGSRDTVVLLTDSGSYFKVGHPAVDLQAGTLTFDHEVLSRNNPERRPTLEAAAGVEENTGGKPIPLTVFSHGEVENFADTETILMEYAKLTASDAAPQDSFGRAVALSGNTALVGARLEDGGGTNSGSAYVFLFNGTTWSEQAKLIAGDADLSDYFGHAVALSGDTALVGAYQDDDAGFSSGSAYVFVRDGTTWSQQAKLTASDAGSPGAFGRAVALRGDMALIGAPYDEDYSGSAYVFARSGTTWSQQAKISAVDAAAHDNFGISVAISGDTVLVGAPSGDGADIDSGSAYVYVRNGTTWSQQAELIASDGASKDRFGSSVALNGNTALVGASLAEGAGGSSGSAYVFTRNGTTWSQQVELIASDAAAGDHFGYSVSLSGNTALVGAYRGDTAVTDSGSAYAFVRCGTIWNEKAKLIASDGANEDFFGLSVALNGNTALVGAQSDDDAGANSGSAYLFELNQPPVALCHDITVEAGGSCFGIIDPEDIDDGSHDPDGGPITLALEPAGPYPLGGTPVTLTVTDDWGDSDSCTATVTVEDHTAPSVSVSLTPDTLRPPNHRMFDVEASVVATDNCGTPEIILSSVTSSEPDDAPGGGDGHTIQDIQDAEVGAPDFEVKLRAERMGSGEGRVYTVAYTATDGSDNETTVESTVHVPHDMGKEQEQTR